MTKVKASAGRITVGELILALKNFKKEAIVYVSSDEELNTLFKDVQIANLKTDEDLTGDDHVVIWGNSGSELD